MKKARRKPKPKQRRSTVFRRTAPSVLAYLHDCTMRSPAHETALRKAVPKRSPLHSSNWVAAGVARAMKASGLPRGEVIAVLDRFFRWCHREGCISQHDTALQVAQLELLRRRHGADPATVALPELCEQDTMSHDELREILAQWEAMSYAVGCGRGDDDDTVELQMYMGGLCAIRYLYVVDGLPVRLDRLDAADFAVHVDTWHHPDNPLERPEGYTPAVLDGAATLYERLREHGFVDSATVERIVPRLHALALAFRKPEAAA